MHRPSVSTADDCPSCGAGLEINDRFPTWCPACEWNLSPATEVVPHRTPRQQRRAHREERKQAARKAVVRVRVEKLYESLAHGATATSRAAGSHPATSRGATWLAVTIAGLVHLLTLGVLAGSVALLCGGTWPMRVLGVIGLALAVALRPRLGRIPDDASVLRRDDAPALYALADRVASAVGAKPVDVIRVTGDFNASFARLGIRRRSRLTLGLPLWTVLTPQQRVALLGHEFGHDVNGDPRRGLWLWSALRALVEWHAFLRPQLLGATRGGLLYVAALLAALVQGVLRFLVRGVLTLLDRLTTRAGQSAEYRADALAAEVGSTAAAQGMLGTILLDRTVETVLLRVRSLPRRRTGSGGRPPVPDLWTLLAEQAASVPELERERLLRRCALDLGAVDLVHPPTHLRIRMLGHRPVQQAGVTLTEDEAAAIEAELAPARKRVAGELTG